MIRRDAATADDAYSDAAIGDKLISVHLISRQAIALSAWPGVSAFGSAGKDIPAKIKLSTGQSSFLTTFSFRRNRIKRNSDSCRHNPIYVFCKAPSIPMVSARKQATRLWRYSYSYSYRDWEHMSMSIIVLHPCGLQPTPRFPAPNWSGSSNAAGRCKEELEHHDPLQRLQPRLPSCGSTPQRPSARYSGRLISLNLHPSVTQPEPNCPADNFSYPRDKRRAPHVTTPSTTAPCGGAFRTITLRL